MATWSEMMARTATIGAAATARWDTLPELPALTGTTKQIAWAETLRARVMEDLRLVSDGETAPFVAWLRGQAAATYWIDTRTQSLADRQNQAR